MFNRAFVMLMRLFGGLAMIKYPCPHSGTCAVDFVMNPLIWHKMIKGMSCINLIRLCLVSTKNGILSAAIPSRCLKLCGLVSRTKRTELPYPQLMPRLCFGLVIHRRKANAGPGLDGWRTPELPALPLRAFVPVARFFQWTEDEFGDNLPINCSPAQN